MKTALIVGGCGYIGRHLTRRLLKDNVSVYILDNLSGSPITVTPKGATFVNGDVRDYDLLRRMMVNIDACYYLASNFQSHANGGWISHDEKTVCGLNNIFSLAKQSKIPVVYTSSADVYGDNAASSLREIDLARPITSYGADMLSCELEARIASITYGIPTAGLRLFDVYGPDDSQHMDRQDIVSTLCRESLQQGCATIFGDGEHIRDFVYISDVVESYIKAMKAVSCNAPIYNVCSGRPTSIIQLARIILSLCEEPCQIKYRARGTSRIRRSFGNPEFARRKAGFSCNYSLFLGIKSVFDGYAISHQDYGDLALTAF